MQQPLTSRFSAVVLVYLALALLLPTDTQASGNAVNASLRTSCNRITVNSASEIGANVAGSKFSYFAELPAVPGYLFDGYLILGNSATNLSYSVQSGPYSGAPSGSNPFGYLLENAPMTVDSLGSASYRLASGSGFNRDSTLGFKVDWYASKHPDSCDFYVGLFRVHKGPNNPVGTVSGLSVAYFADWNIPSDSGFDNSAGYDANRSAVWQKGQYVSPNSLRYGVMGAYRDDGNDIIGGWAVENSAYIDPDGTWENDSLWNLMQGITQDQYRIYSGSPTDLNSGLLIYKNRAVNGAVNDTLRFAIVIAGTLSGGENNMRSALDKGREWCCAHGLTPHHEMCGCNGRCGDADGNGVVTVSDIVFLQSWLFFGGPIPGPCADWDGRDLLTIRDLAYAIPSFPQPVCVSQPRIVAQPTDEITIYYEDVILPNATSATIKIRASFQAPMQIKAFDLPLLVKVDGQAPISLSASTTGETWPGGTQSVKTDSTLGSVLIVDLLGGSIPAGNYVLCTVTLSVEPSQQLRHMTMEYGELAPFMTGVFSGPNSACNYIMFLDQNLAAWEPSLSHYCMCGDADQNGLWTISDVLYLINCIFGTCPLMCHGDADGSNIVTISDAVYLINYIFAGGPAPHCP